ncbi:MAG: LacI family DNA-binding transcriptional regulator [Williamsia sp.]|nr:LacI family DNA-binding transcriptional regulator [Williamsia sp.]
MEKEVTIYDIAERLNVSATTVSRGLQDHPTISKKTKKRIFDLVEELGYRSNQFAKNLRNRRTSTIGVIVGKLNSHFQSAAISGIAHTANRNGYNLLISQSFEIFSQEAAGVKTMFDSRVDGLLVSLAYDTRDLQHFEDFFKKKIPVLFFDRVINHDQCINIVIDNRKAAYRITRHLIDQGKKHIIHITGPLVQNVYIDRLNGYKDALAEAGIPYDPADVIINDLTLEDGKLAATAILQRPQLPDAVFAANDSCAVGCMLTVKAAGLRIPQDIAFAGFNNDPVSQVIEPNLTTVQYDGYAMGQVAANHLLKCLGGDTDNVPTDTIILRSELLIRGSSRE